MATVAASVGVAFLPIASHPVLAIPAMAIMVAATYIDQKYVLPAIFPPESTPPPELPDMRLTTAAAGTAGTKGYGGDVRSAGQVIWRPYNDRVEEQVSGVGKRQEVTNREWLADFAVAVARHEIADVNLILADGDVLYQRDPARFESHPADPGTWWVDIVPYQTGEVNPDTGLPKWRFPLEEYIDNFGATSMVVYSNEYDVYATGALGNVDIARFHDNVSTLMFGNQFGGTAGPINEYLCIATGYDTTGDALTDRSWVRLQRPQPNIKRAPINTPIPTHAKNLRHTTWNVDQVTHPTNPIAVRLDWTVAGGHGRTAGQEFWIYFDAPYDGANQQWWVGGGPFVCKAIDANLADLYLRDRAGRWPDVLLQTPQGVTFFAQTPVWELIGPSSGSTNLVIEQGTNIGVPNAGYTHPAAWNWKPDTMEVVGAEAEFYKGTETQEPSPLIVAREGLSQTPAYRGTAYVVFKGLRVKHWGNRVPNLEFVWSPLTKTWGGAIRAICEQSGAVNVAEMGSPLLDTWWCPGYLTHGQVPATESLSALLIAGDIVPRQLDSKLEFFIRDDVPWMEVDPEFVGAFEPFVGSDDDPPLGFTRIPDRKLPVRGTLMFNNEADDHLTDTVHYFRAGRRYAIQEAAIEERSMRLPMSMSALMARGIVRRVVELIWIERRRCVWRLPATFLVLRENDRIYLNWRGERIRFRVEIVSRGADFSVELQTVVEKVEDVA